MGHSSKKIDLYPGDEGKKGLFNRRRKNNSY